MAMELGFLAEALAAGRSLWNMTIPDVVTAARPVLRRAGAIAKPEERDRRPTEKELEELASFYKFNFGDPYARPDPVRYRFGHANG
ncbi:hypothetical protein SNK04_014266 [Fusarium graminearum]